jgi:hypothetical protein
MLAALLFPSILDSFDLFCRFLDRLAADGTLRILKELKLAAPLALAPYHQRLPARVAPLDADERLPAAVWTRRHERSAAPTAYGVAALDGLETGRAMIPEWASAPASWAIMRVTLHHLATMDAWYFVGGHPSCPLI